MPQEMPQVCPPSFAVWLPSWNERMIVGIFDLPSNAVTPPPCAVLLVRTDKPLLQPGKMPS